MLARLRSTAVVAALVAATGIGLSTSATAAASPTDWSPGGMATGTMPSVMPAAGTFYPTQPLRLLGTPTAGYAVVPGSPVTVAVTGRGDLPSSGVSAVLVNVTATAGASDARLSLDAVGVVAPAPLVTVAAGTTRSTLVTVPLATAAGFDVAASNGPATVTVDVLGFYAADDTVVAGHGVSGGYQPLAVTRLHETTPATPLPAGGRALLAVDLGASATAHATALLVRLTATSPGASGSLSASAASAPAPTSEGPGTLPSSVSFASGTSASNLALVPAEIDSDGRILVAVTNASAAPTGFALDLVGFYDDGAIGPNLRFRPLPQTRILDSGTGVGGVSSLAPDAIVQSIPPEDVAGDSTFALAGVVTVTAKTPAALAVFAGDTTPDAAQSLRVAAGTTSLAVQPEVGATRALGLTATGTDPVAVTMDVVGSFEAFPPVTNPAARHWVPPVSPWQVKAVPR
jgi:hypothetical protein